MAKRDAPDVAKDCWTFSAPSGPKGRFVPTATFFWGVWQFSKNQSAAKELVTYLMEREQVEQRDNGVEGYDIPPFAKHAGPPDLGEGRAADGHGLQLPDPVLAQCASRA